MFNLHLSYSHITWRRPAGGPPPPPPEGLERSFVQTPGGRIEVLSARPAGRGTASSNAPVVFAHGGMGGAWVWAPYMRYLAARGVTSYAVSCRGHGESWCPSFLRMLYGVTQRDLGDDLLAGIRAVHEIEGRDIILVGHSSGGGLSQYLLDRGDVQVRGLALLGAVPGHGSWRIYQNWVSFDPWFAVRMLLHGWHPLSPLSHPALVRRAFFSDRLPEAALRQFQRRLSHFESFLWPLAMFLPFVEPRRLLLNVTGWGIAGAGAGAHVDRVLVMAGTADKMVTPDIVQKTARVYRAAFSHLVEDGGIDATDIGVHPLGGEGGMDNCGHGVRLAWVPGPGHHLQNDVMWEVGAEKLWEFIRQL